MALHKEGLPDICFQSDFPQFLCVPSHSIIYINIQKQTRSIPHRFLLLYSGPIKPVFNSMFSSLYQHLSSWRFFILPLTWNHVWLEGLCIGMSVVKAPFCGAEELIKLAVWERSAHSHFSDLQHLLIVLLVLFHISLEL